MNRNKKSKGKSKKTSAKEVGKSIKDGEKGEVSFEEWQRMNEEVFGEDPSNWMNEDPSDDSEETEELNFDNR